MRKIEKGKLYYNNGFYYKLAENSKERRSGFLACLDRGNYHSSSLSYVFKVGRGDRTVLTRDITIFEEKFITQHLLSGKNTPYIVYCKVTTADGDSNSFNFYHHPDCCGETFINLIDNEDTLPKVLKNYIDYLGFKTSLNNLSFYCVENRNKDYLLDLLLKLAKIYKKAHKIIKPVKITDEYYTIDFNYE